MAINTTQFQAALRPGLMKRFQEIPTQWASIFKPDPLEFPADWLAQYKTEHARACNERWLSKHKNSVRARIERLNPQPWREWRCIRGWHPNTKTDFTLDVVRLQDYLRKWGNDAPYEIYSKKGRKKFVSRRDYIVGPQKLDIPYAPHPHLVSL